MLICSATLLRGESGTLQRTASFRRQLADPAQSAKLRFNRQRAVMTKTNDQDGRKMRIAHQFISALPHARALGMEIVDIRDGEAVVRMPYNQRLIGDPETKVVHGGAVSALMDTCCGAAVMAHPEALGSTATIDLRIDYMRSATPGQAITTTATCYHVTKSVAFVRAVAVDDDKDWPVASATGAFTVVVA